VRGVYLSLCRFAATHPIRNLAGRAVGLRELAGQQA
ncbi:hypothetical protein LCGC14_2511530, partial [marine sediment metagenome]